MNLIRSPLPTPTFGNTVEAVTAVIPAYNEAAHIGDVLQVLSHVPDLAQIIVVDDGSTDDTAHVVHKMAVADKRIELIRLSENRGKSQALFVGTEAADHELILFLDADLLSLQPEHILLLINPVRLRHDDMTLGIFQDGRWQTDFTHSCFPFLSGQRCMRWPLFRDVFADNPVRWSIETAFNLHAWYHRLAVRHVPWRGVSHATRAEKKEGLAGYWSHVRMWGQIGRYTLRFLLNQGWRPKLSERRSASGPISLPTPTFYE